MHVLDAIKSAEDKMHEHKDFFLCSCFVSIKEFSSVSEWIVIFYNPKNHTIVECTCNEGGVSASGESKAMQEISLLDKDSLSKYEDYAIDKVKKDFSGVPMNILVSLHTKYNKTIWTISIVARDFKITTYDIDASGGDVIRKDTSELVRRL
ncbi:MAG: hypothetical protein QMD85_05505 [Candidatus Aenigmarchaeota archaeon]|nr:hypothetical protein [Candidatus Aenigmarchaeota archaeon]